MITIHDISAMTTWPDGREIFVIDPPKRQRTMELRVGERFIRLRLQAQRVRPAHPVPGCAVFRVFATVIHEAGIGHIGAGHIGWIACYQPGNPCAEMVPGWYWRLNSMQALHRSADVRSSVQAVCFQYMTDSLIALADAWAAIHYPEKEDTFHA